MTLSDEEARRRGTQKSILERKAPPTFNVMVEIISRDEVAVHRAQDWPRPSMRFCVARRSGRSTVAGMTTAKW